MPLPSASLSLSVSCVSSLSVSVIRNSSDRGSYRAPRTGSRYLQAAEAYVNRNKANSASSSGTWGASSGHRARSGTAFCHCVPHVSVTLCKTFCIDPDLCYRSRPGLSSDLFQPPGKQTRTASASPALHRKRLPASGPGTGSLRPSEVTSTHSTPSRRPNPRRQNSKVSVQYCHSPCVQEVARSFIYPGFA